MINRSECFFVGVIVGIFAGGLLVGRMQSYLQRKSAIKAGVGKYEVDPQIGRVSFVWITNNVEGTK